MKRILAIVLSLVMIISIFAGCGALHRHHHLRLQEDRRHQDLRKSIIRYGDPRRIRLCLQPW